MPSQSPKGAGQLISSEPEGVITRYYSGCNNKKAAHAHALPVCQQRRADEPVDPDQYADAVPVL